MTYATLEEAMEGSTSAEALFYFLWHGKYAPAIADKLKKESERRADAFVDGATFTVCGEELRMMTPRDLVLIDGFDNAFACATPPTEDDARFLLWTLNAKNSGRATPGNGWRRGRFHGRMDRIADWDAAFSEIYAYMDRIWVDSEPEESEEDKAKRKDKKPPAVYFLAPLMVSVCSEMGAVDPMSGKLLADIPIPRLLQYQKSILTDKKGVSDAGYGTFDSWRSRCLEEVNTILAARRSANK